MDFISSILNYAWNLISSLFLKKINHILPITKIIPQFSHSWKLSRDKENLQTKGTCSTINFQRKYILYTTDWIPLPWFIFWTFSFYILFWLNFTFIPLFLTWPLYDVWASTPEFSSQGNLKLPRLRNIALSRHQGLI